MDENMVFVIRRNDGLTAPCDYNYLMSCESTLGLDDVISYNNLCGAKRFASERAANDFFQKLPSKEQPRHRIERVQPLHLLYFPPYRETA